VSDPFKEIYKALEKAIIEEARSQTDPEYHEFIDKVVQVNPTGMGYAAALGAIARVAPSLATGALEQVEELSKTSPGLTYKREV